MIDDTSGPRLFDGAPPEPGPKASDHTWLHVPSAAPLPVVILSDRGTGYVGHFAGGCMRPCLSADCPLCARKVGTMPRLVYSVYDLRLRMPGLVEVGLLTYHEIERHADAVGHLRGLVITLRKDGSRSTGRIIAEAPDSHPNLPDPLPLALDCRAALHRTWAAQAARRPLE